MKTFYLVNTKPDEPNFPTSCLEEAARHGFSFAELAIEDISTFINKKGEVTMYHKSEVLPLNPADLFYIRTRKPLVAATAHFHYVLESCNCTYNEQENSLHHQIITSKMTQPFVLKAADIFFPNSLVSTVSNLANIKPLIEKHFSYPFVLKLSGSKGEKVWKCEDATEYQNLLSEIGVDSNLMVQIQEYIPNTFDIRVIVLYGEVIGAIARTATDGFYNNISRGGTAQKIEITDEEKRMSIEAARLIKLELAGVDIVRSENGPLLFEINKTPDIEAFSKACGFDLVTHITKKFIERSNNLVLEIARQTTPHVR